MQSVRLVLRRDKHKTDPGLRPRQAGAKLSPLCGPTCDMSCRHLCKDLSFFAKLFITITYPTPKCLPSSIMSASWLVSVSLFINPLIQSNANTICTEKPGKNPQMILQLPYGAENQESLKKNVHLDKLGKKEEGVDPALNVRP